MSGDIAEAARMLAAARRLLTQHHDIVDAGPANEHPGQAPNWAMRATNLIDEALELVENKIDR